jgi:hypothetical protein
MDQAAKLIYDFLVQHPQWQDMFCGLQPYTSANTQLTASIGSYFCDLCYYQVASMYGVLKSKNSQLNAPNKEFNILYNKTLAWAEPNTILHTNKSYAMGRASNNKGNTMETLMLAMAEAGKHGIVWTLVWIQFMHQHKDLHVEWLQQVDF